MEKITDKNTLKSWFKRGLKPLESQFHAWMDSYWHKTEMIPTSRIDNLETILNKKAENSEILSIGQLLEKKVDKEQGKELMPSPSPVPGTNTFLCEDGTWKTVDYNEAFPELPENADKTYYLSPLLSWEKLPDNVLVISDSASAEDVSNCKFILDYFPERLNEMELSIVLKMGKRTFVSVGSIMLYPSRIVLTATNIKYTDNNKCTLYNCICTINIDNTNSEYKYLSHSIEIKVTEIPAETIIEVVSEYPADLSSYPDGSIFIKQQV